MKDFGKDVKNEFWDAMEDVGAGMLGLEGGDLIPMTPKVRDDAKDGKIWFITVQGNDLHSATLTGPQKAQLVVTDRSEGIWADIRGTLTAESDPAVLDEIWGPMSGVWFEKGREDSDVRLMCFVPEHAEVTLTDDNPMKFFYEVAKAKVTQSTPDLQGWQGKITF